MQASRIMLHRGTSRQEWESCSTAGIIGESHRPDPKARYRSQSRRGILLPL